MKCLPSTRPYFSRSQQKFIQNAIKEVLNSGRLILGPYNEQLEGCFREYLGTPYAVTVSSGTAALEIALRYAQVRGREVIVPTNTFVATANAVWFAGGRPVLADVDPRSLCLDVEDMERKINSNTHAVIVVHIAGLIHPQIEEIKRICERHSLFLIEDVAHALGAAFDGRKGGTFGDAGCFSFYPTKVMTTGTGGLIVTSDEKLQAFARSARHHGAGPRGLTDVRNLGNDWLMNEISAVLGVAQLGEIEQMIARRRQVAVRYAGALEKLDGIELFPEWPGCRHVFYKYPILIRTSRLRNRLMRDLRSTYGIETGSIYFPPIHRQPFHAKALSVRSEEFPSAERVLNRVLCLPISVQMTNREIQHVITSLREAIGLATLDNSKHAPSMRAVS